MDFLLYLESRIGRWLAYADSCINAEGELARCQPFWAFVALALGALCLVVVISVVARIILDRRKRAASPGVQWHSKPR